MGINVNAQTLDLLIRMIRKRRFRLAGPQDATHEAVESRKALLIPNFVRAISSDLPKVVLVCVDPVRWVARVDSMSCRSELGTSSFSSSTDEVVHKCP